MQVTAERLIEKAEEASGLRADPGSSYHEGLALVADGLSQDFMAPGGRSRLLSDAINSLVNRFRVDEMHDADPALGSSPVESPVFILGLPRTGTTVVSYLMDQDPQWRTLLNWEAVLSVPPPTTATLRTDPRCLEILDFQKAILPTLDPPPPHWEWADGPTECTFVLAQDFRSVMYDTRIPHAPLRDWIESTDLAPAYRHHRRTLQVLQSQAPGRWVLKMPAHAYFIEGLLEVYPDAKIIWTHRDPVTSMASFLDLAGFAQGVSIAEQDPGWIKATYPNRLADYVRRAEAALAGRDVHHVHYADTVGDPIGVIRGVYDWLGASLADEPAQAMRDWLDRDPIRKPRKRRYSLADWDMTPADMDPIFNEYVDEYGIARDA